MAKTISIAVAARINEISVFRYGSPSKYSSSGGLAARRQLESDIEPFTSKEDTNEIADQDGRARLMVEEFIKWAKDNGYKGSVVDCWWTAKPGDLTRVTGKTVDSSKNPTDVLFKFTSGPAGSDGFLGLSAKSTGKAKEIGFKNPGVGTLEKLLGIELSPILDEYVARIVKLHKFSTTSSKRKTEIRSSSKKVQDSVDEMGSLAMKDLRDFLLKKYKGIKDQDFLKKHILDDWMNFKSDDETKIYPPYIKVTGQGTKGRYTVSITDPNSNSKLDYIKKNKITFEAVGNESIGVKAGTHQLMKIRFKFESQKLASSMKLSGDPW
jgi:hypothetical protein